MTRPIVGFLAEFTPVARPADIARAAPVEDAGLAEAERVEALVRTAREQGLAEGRALAEAAALDRMRQLGDTHVADLAAARSAWLAEQGAALAGALRMGLAALEEAIGENLAAAATPFIETALRERTMRELKQALAELMAGGAGPVVSVRGPADLLDGLRAAWGEAPSIAFCVAEMDETDVVIEAGDTTIRSQMQAWSDRFSDAFQGPA